MFSYVNGAAEACAALGVKVANVLSGMSGLEQHGGVTPRLLRMIRAAKAKGVDVDQLLRGDYMGPPTTPLSPEGIKYDYAFPEVDFSAMGESRAQRKLLERQLRLRMEDARNYRTDPTPVYHGPEAPEPLPYVPEYYGGPPPSKMPDLSELERDPAMTPRLSRLARAAKRKGVDVDQLLRGDNLGPANTPFTPSGIRYDYALPDTRHRSFEEARLDRKLLENQLKLRMEDARNFRSDPVAVHHEPPKPPPPQPWAEFDAPQAPADFVPEPSQPLEMSAADMARAAGPKLTTSQKLPPPENPVLPPLEERMHAAAAAQALEQAAAEAGTPLPRHEAPPAPVHPDPRVAKALTEAIEVPVPPKPPQGPAGKSLSWTHPGVLGLGALGLTGLGYGAYRMMRDDD